MPEVAAGPDTYSCEKNGQVFLLTEAGVLVQELGTRLWRSVPAPAGTPETAAPTPSQVRSLRQKPGRRRRPSPWAGAPARPSGGTIANRPGEATVTLEIYNPLTATWSAVPQGVRRTQVGEAVCCTLPDGRLLIGAITSRSCATYDPASNQWSTAPLTAAAPRRSAGLSCVIAVRMSD